MPTPTTGEFVDETGSTRAVPLTGTDADQAEWLARDLAQSIRFNHATKMWHIWNGIIWAPDKDRTAEETVLRMARERVEQVAHAGLGRNLEESALKLVRRLYDVARLTNAMKALSFQPAYKTDGSDWDQVPYLLGCKNGILDLRTGELDTSPSPDSLVTKSTRVAYDPTAINRAPRFSRFLEQITSEDDSLVEFFIRWFGYCLFGRTDEQKFLILTGSGRNGKGALTHVVRHVIGDYDAKASQGIYMRNRWGSARSSEARSDLMTLKGARIAVMSEPEGGAFNEELLKAHTGGDPIVARPLYGPEMMWEPTHTITFLTNRPPTVEDIGPAMAARVLVADFRERYEGKNANPKLYSQLEAEGEGVLAMLVAGAVRWWQDYENGQTIPLPERVLKASRSYLEQNDPVGQVIADEFVRDPDATMPARDFYVAYLRWHQTSDDPSEPLSATAFGLLAQRRGLIKRRNDRGNYYIGIRLKNAVEKAQEDA